MARKLKVFGLLLTAALALNASTAFAQQGELTADGPVTLTGEETGPLVANSTTYAAGFTTCTGTTFTGHKVRSHAETTEGGTHQLLPSGSTAITLTPHHSNHCKMHIVALGTRPMTVTMNGCDYVLNIGQTVDEVEGKYGVTTDIVCPEGKLVETQIYKSGSEHLAGNLICKYTIKPQSGLSGLYLTHTTGEGDDFDLSGTLKNIHEEHSGTLCSSGTGLTEQHLDLTFRGHNAEGSSTPVTITDS